MPIMTVDLFVAEIEIEKWKWSSAAMRRWSALEYEQPRGMLECLDWKGADDEEHDDEDVEDENRERERGEAVRIESNNNLDTMSNCKQKGNVAQHAWRKKERTKERRSNLIVHCRHCTAETQGTRMCKPKDLHRIQVPSPCPALPCPTSAPWWLLCSVRGRMRS